MIILSFDFGTKNIGVAVGQKITKTASALKNITVKNGIPNWKNISSIIKYWKPKLIIIGYPLNMDGTKQKITQKVHIFAKNIQLKYNIHVELHDERLTTVESKTILYEYGGYKKLKKNNIHSLSAIIILESWLNQNFENTIL
ncbi:Holliday junction resolvase RuvX [Buchnera aphidicola]|uniref:Holliday junction resolvase RuvX n=1 Tax=Buchnera aphidicola TaxID=9 RepID=UPI003463B407